MWEAGPLRCSLEVGFPTMLVLLLLAQAVLGLPEGGCEVHRLVCGKENKANPLMNCLRVFVGSQGWFFLDFYASPTVPLVRFHLVAQGLSCCGGVGSSPYALARPMVP